MSAKGVAILGSTGSIGTTALRVLERQRTRFRVAALTAYANGALLEQQAARYAPDYVGLVRMDGGAVRPGWSCGEECLVEAATRPEVDIVLNAVVGAAGLDATMAALAGGKRVALANKESLVMGGELVRAAARQGGGELVPVDSEHSAILQCIAGRPRSEVRRLVITEMGLTPGAMTLLFESFAYRRGVPTDADFVFDARCLPNPHWDAKLRPLSGKDAPVREWLESRPEVIEFGDDVRNLLERWLPHFEVDGRSYVTICIGCTGGRHRSVYLAERLAEQLRERHAQVLTYHREME